VSDTLILASDPKELLSAQTALIADVEAKREAAIEEARAAHDMELSAISANLSVAAAKRIHRRATARVGYLTKVGQALQAGYVMMPDMPGDIVAVRVNRNSPASSRLSDWSHFVQDERCQNLTAGIGKYVSPRQTVEKVRVSDKVLSDGRTTPQYKWRAVALRNPDGLDRRFLRPEVMSRLSAAMTMKLFDEIVTVRPQSRAALRARRSRDPIALGRIVDDANGNVTAFLVAWFMDKRYI
jgi:hypothetical protein